MAASSCLLPSFSPQTPAISSKSQAIALASPLSFTSSKPFSAIKNLSFPANSSFPLLRKASSLHLAFVPKVAWASEVEQEEEEEEEVGTAVDGEAAQFSPDLKLYVGNLPFSVDSSQLAGLFQRAGNVEMVEVIYDKLTGRSRGFGFVTMSTEEETEAAAQQFNGYTFEGRALRVNSGPPPQKSEFSSRRFQGGGNLDSANRVHVGNLSWGVDNVALQNLFSEQGNVIDAKVIYDRESGRSKGFGFVTYSSAKEVDNAITSLDGADLDGRSIRVSAAEPRERRQF